MSHKNISLTGSRILVVEDDYFVAQVLVDLLEAAGAEVIGPIGWVDQAIEFLDKAALKIDAALLDVNLHGKKSYPVADALISRSVRIVFSTGYDTEVLDKKYQHFPRCEKPFTPDALLAALASD